MKQLDIYSRFAILKCSLDIPRYTTTNPLSNGRFGDDRVSRVQNKYPNCSFFSFLFFPFPFPFPQLNYKMYVLFIQTHEQVLDINILVAILGLGHFSWLKESKKINIYWVLVHRCQIRYPCSSPWICWAPKTHVPEVTEGSMFLETKRHTWKG